MTTYRTAEGSEYKASYGSMTIVDEFTINKTAGNQMMRDEINIRNDEYGVSVKIPAIFSQEETKMVVDELTSGEKYDKFKAAMEADDTFAGATINSEVIDVKTDWFGQNLEFEDDADLFIRFPEEFATESHLPPYNVYSLDDSGNVTEPDTRLVKKAGELGVIVKTKQTGSYALAFAGEAKAADNPNPDNPNPDNPGGNTNPGGNNGTGTQTNTGNTANVNNGTNSAQNPASYTVEQGVTLTAPSRTGYTFLGWTYEGQTTPDKNITIVVIYFIFQTNNTSFSKNYLFNNFSTFLK